MNRITNFKWFRQLAAQVADTAAAVAAGIAGTSAALKCDEKGSLRVSVPDGVTVTAQSAVAYSSSTATIGAASAQLLAASSTRQTVVIQNTHATQTLYISFTNPATTSDMQITAGSSLSISAPTPSNAIYAIASGAGTTVAMITA